MTASQLSVVVQSAIGFVILLIMLLILLPVLRLDLFRQQMFALRDELFDYARNGKIQYDHPAYLLLRKSMNGFIRYGHRLSLFQLMMTFCRWRILGEKPTTEWAKRWDVALESVENEETRKALEAFHIRSMDIVVNRLVMGSVPIFATVAIVVAVLVAGNLLEGVRRSMAETYRAAAAKVFVAFFIDQNTLQDEALRSALA